MPNYFYRPEEDSLWKERTTVFGNVFDIDRTIEEMMKMAGVFEGCKFYLKYE